MNKRLLCMLLALVLLCGVLSGCGSSSAPAATEAPAETQEPEQEATEPETREFTDDCGRTVTLPSELSKIAVSGPLAQVYVFPLCPELLVGFSSAFTVDEAKYIPEQYRDLPELGQLYGGKGTMDLEALLAAAPDVVIDVGDAKDGMVQDLDDLSEQTGIPFVHIDASVVTAPQAYRRLGELTGKTEQAEALAVWCEEVYAMVSDMMEQVDADGARRSVLYCLGDKGLNVIAEGSYHAETINLLADNLAKIDEVVSSGMGNEVDMEQIILWNPSMIVFAPDSIYDSYAEEASWQQLEAVQAGEVFKTPYGPYGWLSSPPAVQRYLGMLWLGELMYPDYVQYDLQEKVTEYYQLFYGYELSDSDYAELTAGALRAE